MNKKFINRTKPGMTETNGHDVKTIRQNRTKNFINSILTPILLLSNTAVAFEKLSRDISSSYEIPYLSTSDTTAGYTISTPGYYYLSSDLTIAPGNGNYSGIYINANNVILDLNSHILKMTTTGIPPAGNIYGIQIAAGKKNITIINGTIDGIGITTQSLLTGIYAPGTANSTIKDLHIKNIDILSCRLYGLHLSFCRTIEIDTLHAIETISTAANSFPAGLYIDNCLRGNITNLSVHSTSCQTTEQGASYGVYATTSKNFIFKDANVSGGYITNISTNERSSISGIHLKNCQSFYFKDCKTINNRHEGISTNSSSGNECCGIFLDTTTDCEFDGCWANNNSGGYKYGSNYTCSTYGFKLTSSSSGNRFINCTTSNNSGAADCAGIFIGQSGHNIFESCYSFNNTSSKTNFGSRFAFGITSTFGSNNSFKNCKITGNKIATRTSNKGYGIALRSDLSSVVRLCEIHFNGSGAVIAAGEAYGIALLGHCNNCVLQQNLLHNNHAATRRYGIKDFAANSLSLLTGNIAFGHGTCLTGVSTMTDTGTMNFFVSYSAPAADVRKVFKENFYYLIGNFSSTSDDLNWYNLSVQD